MEEEKAQAEEAAANYSQAPIDDNTPPETGASEASGPTGYKQAGGHGAATADTSGRVNKANVLNRVIARFIDILIALLLARLPGYIGFFAALTYIGIADGLMGGRSIGKRIIGLRVFNPGKNRAADFRDSVLRNFTIGLAFMLSQLPMIGWILAAAVLGFELVLIIGNEEGRRMGDEIASTVVLEDPGQETGAKTKA